MDFLSSEEDKPAALDLFTVSDKVFSPCHARVNSPLAILMLHTVCRVCECIAALGDQRWCSQLVFVCQPSDALHVHLYIWLWVEYPTSGKELNKSPLTACTQGFIGPIFPIIPGEPPLSAAMRSSWEERVCWLARIGFELDYMCLAEEISPRNAKIRSPCFKCAMFFSTLNNIPPWELIVRS